MFSALKYDKMSDVDAKSTLLESDYLPRKVDAEFRSWKRRDHLFCMHQPELPIKGNVDSGVFKVYYPDTGLLLASLDEEAALDFKVNRNFHTYKGGIAENIVAEAIVKSGKPLGYFKRENSTLELDFLLRTADALVPVEVKSSNNNAKSLKTAIASAAYPDIRFGIKLVAGNIGHENAIYTFPRFCAFLLPRFLADAKDLAAKI